jgi:CRP-like cAMP-binding protein
VLTKDGTRVRRHQGDFFGEGALLHPQKIRSATIHCVTPINAIEISREYFEKYLASSGLKLDLKEKDRTRKRNRAKTLLRLQKNLKPQKFKRGDIIFAEGDSAEGLFILEDGKVDVQVEGKRVFTTKPGDIFGEHSLVLCRPRNTSAVCVSDTCTTHEMKARDFYELYESHPNIKSSLRELCYRREFQKALVKMTKKEFPSINDLADVFNAADIDGTGFLEIDEVKKVLISFDPSLSETEIKEVLMSLDLDESGRISFDGFKLIFGMNEARAASI